MKSENTPTPTTTTTVLPFPTEKKALYDHCQDLHRRIAYDERIRSRILEAKKGSTFCPTCFAVNPEEDHEHLTEATPAVNRAQALALFKESARINRDSLAEATKYYIDHYGSLTPPTTRTGKDKDVPPEYRKEKPKKATKKAEEGEEDQGDDEIIVIINDQDPEKFESAKKARKYLRENGLSVKNAVKEGNVWRLTK